MSGKYIKTLTAAEIEQFKEIYEAQYGPITLDEAEEKAERLVEFMRLMLD